MDTDPYQSLGMVILAFILILLNAFFVLSEFALVKIRRSKLEELVKQNNQTAKLALKMSHSLDSYLSATQLGITLSSLALGWVGNHITALILHSLAGVFSNNQDIINAMSLLISFSLVTLLHVILGEIVPKSIAIARSEQACLAIARPLYMFWAIFYPVIKFFDFASAMFLKLLKVEAHHEAHSDEELKIIVGESLKGGYLDSIEGEIIKNAVDFSDTLAREIMTPRKNMICLDKTFDYQKNIDIITSPPYHTRYPYCEGSKDKILGIIHIRDIISVSIKNNNQSAPFDSLVKKMLVVPESASISQIMLKMNKKKVDTALVIDEYGGTAGMITAEDIMHEIMGNIIVGPTPADELKKIDDKSYEVDGKIELEKIEELFKFEYEEYFMQVTIGGYVLNLFGDMPNVGDKISDSLCQYEVLSVEEHRIKKLKITLL
ncbi:HlyC/CorC family transporter [Helicobacter muridarum]|uniref:HlyC/CorC family transporter n=1 Tax=Helicobacter muridarum TaxID=216 RepID=A0A377PTK1_9HELI|nr:hemolysin family protein [Helicobacter muridarum]TLE00604.1 HlyC/CorC family transporter [Helicobacter muridarum]STQ85621.1 integral membrane protein [Helicobacter muridarum]